MEIATLGDMPNDVLMFEKSGVSIATATLARKCRHPPHYVTATNEDEGFAKAIEKFVLNTRAAKCEGIRQRLTQQLVK